MSIVLAENEILVTEEVGGIFYTEQSKPLTAPVISSVSGTVATGETFAINGSFTAKRNGQLKYFTGNLALNGIVEEGFVPINGAAVDTESPAAYRHSTEQSFSGSGASLKFNNVAGASFGANNPKFLLPNRSREIYYTYTARVVMTDWASQSGGQVKMGRICSVENSHSFEPTMGMTPLRNGSSSVLENYIVGTVGFNLKNGASNAIYEDTFNKWTRYEMWDKLPDYPSKNQAVNKYWSGGLICDDETILTTENSTGEIELIDQIPTVNWENIWAEQAFDKVLLPFYIRDWMTCYWYLDNIYINDSPERVEIGNNSVLENCTKKIVQEQTSRSQSQIVCNLRLGNFDSSDNIYLFVVNSDGQKTDGSLIRSAA